MSELDALRRIGDQIVPPPFQALRETARRRARRARVATTVAVAASLVAVTATTVYLGRAADREVEPAPPLPAPSSRPLTYADGRTIHYGEHTVEADGAVVELDVTDYGVGFRTDDGQIWFTDGSTIDPLGALGETGPGYGDDKWPLTTRPGWSGSSSRRPTSPRSSSTTPARGRRWPETQSGCSRVTRPCPRWCQTGSSTGSRTRTLKRFPRS